MEPARWGAFQRGQCAPVHLVVILRLIGQLLHAGANSQQGPLSALQIVLEMHLGDFSVRVVLFKGLNRLFEESLVRDADLLAEFLAVGRDLLPVKDQFENSLRAFLGV